MALAFTYFIYVFQCVKASPVLLFKVLKKTPIRFNFSHFAVLGLLKILTQNYACFSREKDVFIIN